MCYLYDITWEFLAPRIFLSAKIWMKSSEIMIQLVSFEPQFVVDACIRKDKQDSMMMRIKDLQLRFLLYSGPKELNRTCWAWACLRQRTRISRLHKLIFCFVRDHAACRLSFPPITIAIGFDSNPIHFERHKLISSPPPPPRTISDHKSINYFHH